MAARVVCKDRLWFYDLDAASGRCTQNFLVVLFWRVLNIYIIIQFTIVHTMSHSSTAFFCGKFNNAALVVLNLLLPFLQLHKLPPVH